MIAADKNGDCDEACAAPFINAGAAAVFLYSFGDAYVGRRGKLTWVGDAPIVGGRFAYWDGFENTTSLARKLRQLPKVFC